MNIGAESEDLTDINVWPDDLGVMRNNIWNIEEYISLLRTGDFCLAANKINYEFGVPLKYLTKAVLKNEKKLMEVCRKYASPHPELERDADEEMNYLLNCPCPWITSETFNAFILENLVNAKKIC